MVDFEVAGQSCGSAMWGLSKKICSGKGARECPQLDGLFNYIKGHSGGYWGLGSGKPWERITHLEMEKPMLIV